MLQLAIIFTLRRTPLLWTFTRLRTCVIALFANNFYSATHDDPPILTNQTVLFDNNNIELQFIIFQLIITNTVNRSEPIILVGRV